MKANFITSDLKYDSMKFTKEDVAFHYKRLEASKLLGKSKVTSQLNVEVRQFRQALKKINTPYLYLYYKRKGMAVEQSGLVKSIKDRARLYRQLREQIKYTRMNRQEKHTRRKMRYNMEYWLTGGVFTTSNSILKLLKTKKLKGVYDDKSPMNGKPHVGIELEFCTRAQHEEIAELLSAEELTKHVTLKNDGSLRPNDGDYGHEICILAEEKKIAEVVSKVCGIIEKVEGYVNKSCGMHVHVDLRRRDRNLVFNNLVAAQSILYSMVPTSRRTNQYCRPIRGRQWHMPVERYRGINPHAYERHQTIEVRIHSGTVNADKISNWVDVILAVVNAPMIEGNVRSFKAFSSAVTLSEELGSYVKARIKKFKNDQIAESETDELPSAERDAPTCDESHCGDSECEGCNDAYGSEERQAA